jgi:hypothetical protein
MKALAVTDHGVMCGAIEFYGAATAAGIKPIIGIEQYVAPRRVTAKEGKADMVLSTNNGSASLGDADDQWSCCFLLMSAKKADCSNSTI